jgi:hypothetical protein
MLIFNIKIDKGTTGNYLALEKAFFLKNKQTERKKQQSRTPKTEMRLK